jgi:hypothetical protein
LLNINKSSTRVKYLRREYIIILTKVEELYIASLENKKSIIIIKIIITNRKKSLLLFVIAFKKQIIDNWINKKLISKERIAITLISYTNNKVTL